MTTTRRPTLTAGPASSYAQPGQLIREFSDGRSGGLLSISRHPLTDRLTVEVYRTDADVSTIGNTPTGTHEVNDETYAPESPDDLNPGETLGTVHVFGHLLTPQQAEALATRLQLLAQAARLAAQVAENQDPAS